MAQNWFAPREKKIEKIFLNIYLIKIDFHLVSRVRLGHVSCIYGLFIVALWMDTDTEDKIKKNTK